MFFDQLERLSNVTALIQRYKSGNTVVILPVPIPGNRFVINFLLVLKCEPSTVHCSKSINKHPTKIFFFNARFFKKRALPDVCFFHEGNTILNLSDVFRKTLYNFHVGKHTFSALIGILRHVIVSIQVVQRDWIMNSIWSFFRNLPTFQIPISWWRFRCPHGGSSELLFSMFQSINKSVSFKRYLAETERTVLGIERLLFTPDTILDIAA